MLAIEEASFSNPWSRQMFLWELQNVGVSYAYVLRTPEWRVAAFCTIWVVLDEIHINNVAVRPECRGQRVGQALLEVRPPAGGGARRPEGHARGEEVERGSSKLYERLGFQVAGTRRNYYSNPVEDALILWREHLAEGWAGEG